MGQRDASEVELALEKIKSQASAEEVAISQPERTKIMKCTIQGCPGEYEARTVVHTVKQKGNVVVIDHVPAEVCSVCGDVLMTPETVRRIEKLLRKPPRPAKAAPLYEFA